MNKNNYTVKDFSNQDLKMASFVDHDLRYSNFTNSDIRGTDFSGANLNGVNFTGARTGIPPLYIWLIFLAALIISLCSSYFAMLGGKAVQELVFSKHEHERTAGTLALVIIIIFIIYAWLAGGGAAVWSLVVPIVAFALLIAFVIYLTGIGTGKGMFYIGVSLILVTVMLITGTIARTVAGSLSGFYFTFVALSGSIFSKTVDGGLGTLVLSVVCVLISKRALDGARHYTLLRKVSMYITRSFGTSFRNAKMVNVRFSGSKIRNADFTSTEMTVINWGNAKRINCISGKEIFSDE